MAFDNRRAAGCLLAQELRAYAGGDAVVVGITRGGVVVAAEVARSLHLPLDVLVTHKIVEPGQCHLHLGVVVEPTHLVVQRKRLCALALRPEWLDTVVAYGIREVRRRGAAIRTPCARLDLRGHPVIVIDDSAATGATLKAAVRAVRTLGARSVVVAVPVAPLAVLRALQRQVDRIVRLALPSELVYNAIYYPIPDEVSDEGIRDILHQHRRCTES
jgi:putative phosphoribosyl transferase